MARNPRQSATPRKQIKVTASLDADLYVRMAAGAAMRQVSHSRFVADALALALADQGVFVGTRRRNSGSGDSSCQVEESAGDAA